MDVMAAPLDPASPSPWDAGGFSPREIRADPMGSRLDPGKEAAMAINLDHFLFYDIQPVQAGNRVLLRGQFDDFPLPADLTAARWFANPVSKDEEPILNRNHHLNAYEIFVESPEPRRIVQINNQFGPQRLLVDAPELLLVPAFKMEEGLGPPEGLDHFKCYKVIESEPIGPRTVSLSDQFVVASTEVGPALFFCVPVEKQYDGRVEPIQNPDAHLAIYEILPRDYPVSRTVKDQFRAELFNILRSALLAVPSEKVKWEAIPT
jgi:hypothetical protein